MSKDNLQEALLAKEQELKSQLKAVRKTIKAFGGRTEKKDKKNNKSNSKSLTKVERMIIDAVSNGEKPIDAKAIMNKISRMKGGKKYAYATISNHVSILHNNGSIKRTKRGMYTSK